MDKAKLLREVIRGLEAEGLQPEEVIEKAKDGAHAVRVVGLKQKHLDEALRIVRLAERVRVAQRRWVVGEGEAKAKALRECKALERDLDELLGLVEKDRGVPLAKGQTSLFPSAGGAQ